MTNAADRQLLLRVAREAIEAHVARRPPRLPPLEGVLARAGGAFVSLHIHGELRGCIGQIEADGPLGDVIPRCAVAACSSDPRFPAVTGAEVPDLTIELSLLGELEALRGPEAIEIGRHGLVVESGRNRGLLLPQVATEWKWDRETFLAQTCRKAGLAHDAWKSGVKTLGATALGVKTLGVKLWRFEAEVFTEPRPPP
jgi:AmmeMemoRadiSam system protein A